MAIRDFPLDQGTLSPAETLYARVYRAFAYFGLMSLSGSVLFGFRFGPEAVSAGYVWNLLLYAAFIVPHLVMTRSWFKRWVWGNPAGTPRERRVYIVITILTWLAVVAFHRPVPGPFLGLPAWAGFLGVLVFLLGFMMFFEGITRKAIDGLLGVPGAVSAYSHGPETPLFTEGAYASVRHPMYRSFLVMCVGSLMMHPHAGQLFWIVLLVGTFIAFIPVEEAQLIRARGDDYRKYMQQTPWRLVRGIW